MEGNVTHIWCIFNTHTHTHFVSPLTFLLLTTLFPFLFNLLFSVINNNPYFVAFTRQKMEWGPLSVCVRTLPGCWYCVCWVLSAGQSEGVKEYLLILATHLFYWKSLDCFCSAPRLPLSVSLPLMKLQMNWSTYWLLSFSPPLTHRPPQCLYHTSWLSLCMSLSLLLSLSSLISLFLSSSHASILFITFVTLSPSVLILPILSVSLLTNFPVHLTFFYHLFTLSLIFVSPSLLIQIRGRECAMEMLPTSSR